MDYFATFNQMYGSVNENFFKAVHYDFTAGLLLMILLIFIVSALAFNMNLDPVLEEIEQRKIYDRQYEDE